MPEFSAGLGEVCALASAVTWALTSTLVRAASAHVGPAAANAVRATVAGLLLLVALAVALALGVAAPVVTAEALALLVVSVVIGLGIADTLYFESLRLLGVARALPLTSSYPLFVTALAVLFLREPLTPRLLVGVVVTVVGVALVATPPASPSRPAEPASWRGLGAVLVACLLWAGSTILLRPVLAQVDAFVANAVRMPAAAVLLWLFLLRRPGGRPAKVERGALWPVLLAGLLSAAGSLAFLLGLQWAGAAKTATLASTAPLFAIPVALVTGERVGMWLAVGTALGVIGVVLLVSQ